jgi:antibiotic biosynthesis monooxygenase (ABM) superfamily enzyme
MEDDRDYISIFRYDTYEHLKNWMQSELRAEFIERAKEFSETPVLVTYHSLEHWFVRNADKDMDDFSVASSDNNKAKGGPPAKYKMVVVVFLVIWFQLHFVLPNTVGKIDALSPLAQESLGTLIITTLTTYVFMPISTRILAFWLFPGCDYLSTLKELLPSFSKNKSSRSKHGRKQSNSSFRHNLHAPSQITTKT